MKKMYFYSNWSNNYYKEIIKKIFSNIPENKKHIDNILVVASRTF